MIAQLFGALFAFSIPMFLLRNHNPVARLTLALFVLAVIPIPAFLAQGIHTGLGTLYWSDIISLLLLAELTKHASRTSDVRPFGHSVILALLLASGCAIGWLSGADAGLILRDARGMFRLAVMIPGVCVAISDEGIGRFLSSLAKIGAGVSIWTLFAVIVTGFLDASIFTLRTEVAAIYTASGNSEFDATRVTPDSGLLCSVYGGIGVASFIRYRGMPRSSTFQAIGVMAAIAVVLMGFTRGHFIVFCIVLLGGTLFLPKRLGKTRRGRSPHAFFLVLAIVLLATLAMSSQAIRDDLSGVWDGFRGRVIVGLQPSTIEQDSSNYWRVKEASAAWKSIGDHAIVGTGLGVRYRGTLPGEIFPGDTGLTYIHNSYLWVLVKLGFVGAAALGALFLSIASRPVALSRRGERALALLVTLPLLAIFAQSYVSPTPFESYNSVVVGVLCGLAVSFPNYVQELADASVGAMTGRPARVGSVPFSGLDHR